MSNATRGAVAHYSTWFECTKRETAHTTYLVEDACAKLGLRLTWVSEDKGWLRHYRAFRISGPQRDIDQFRRWWSDMWEQQVAMGIAEAT